MTTAARLLPKFAALAVILLYGVVLAGSVVRATGSGMGCPDWPRCFGRLIPPVDVSQIPPALMEKFLTEGHGNLLHTWIEWVNRLFGAASGLAALGTFVCALLVREARRQPLLMSLLAVELILFGTVAWLGKVVVDSSLLPWMVTIHVMVAIAVVSAAVGVRHLVAGRPAVPAPRSLQLHLAATLALGLAQIALGTQVRELVDHLPAGACCDGRLEQSLGGVLMWHRAGALLVTALAAAAWWRLRRIPAAVAAAPVLIFLAGFLVLCEYLAGVLLVRLHLPAWIQPVHLVLAFAFHGTMLSLLLRSRLHIAPLSPTVSAV